MVLCVGMSTAARCLVLFFLAWCIPIQININSGLYAFRLLLQLYLSAFVDSVRHLWLPRLLRQPTLALMTLVVSLTVTWKVVGLIPHHIGPGFAFRVRFPLLLQS